MTPYLNEQLGCEGSMSQHDTLTLEPGSARHFIEWCKAQPEDREPTTLESALAEFEASLSATQPAQADGEADLKTQVDMLQSWHADDEASINKLTAHLRSVLDIARTWQPDYATKMDRDTLDLAAAEVGHKWEAQPYQAAQGEPAEHWHRLYLEKCQQYNDRVAQLGAEIEGLEAEAAQGTGEVVAWTSVNDALPDGEPGDPEVLFYSDDKRNPVDTAIGVYRADGWFSVGFEFVNVTHWKPKPATPTPPAQAAADARDARLAVIDRLLPIIVDCARHNQHDSTSELLTQLDGELAAIATHQQGGE